MHFYAYHGVERQEQVVGNNYEVELMLNVPCENAMRTDSLSYTINYAEVYREISELMSTPSQLLENVAGRIISMLKVKFPSVRGGRVAVYKENPPIRGKIDKVGVIVEW